MTPLGCALALLLPGVGRTEAHHLSPGPAGSLQAAIDVATAGDTITLLSGVYAGSLRLEKRLTLIGNGEAVIRGDGIGSTITILADNVTITGLNIEHCGRSLADDDAGMMIRADNCRISNNHLTDVLFGIYFYSADSCIVDGNRIFGRDSLEFGERGSGLHLWDSHYNQISNNQITAVRDGFYVQNSNRTIFTRNVVTNVRYGLHYMYSDNNSFLNNIFTGNIAGAAVMYSDGIVIRGNRFLHNRGFSSFGILFQDCSGLEVDSNLIADNVIGMFFEATRNSRIENNIIAGNDVALQMFQNSTGNSIYNNNFIDNCNPLIIVGKRTGSSWNVQGRGNYWSAYKGYDLDEDGVGDIPMKIHNVFEYIEGRYPLIRLYLYSPASQALALATEAFPIFDLNEEEDNFPLMKPIACGIEESPDKNDLQSEGRSGRGKKLTLLFVGAAVGGVFLGVGRRRRPH